jgi:lipid A 4'-phosphatase
MTRERCLALALLAILIAFVLWPHMDLVVSGWFYRADGGFTFADQPVFLFLHYVAYYGARVLGATLPIFAIIAAVRRKPLWSIDAKGWLFLLFGLLVAPGLVGNVILKDHWGRPRPREITEFGGTAQFQPPLIPHKPAHKNQSFVAGDPAFGFAGSFSRSLIWSAPDAGLLAGLVMPRQ